jgi:hypothetical protein
VHAGEVIRPIEATTDVIMLQATSLLDLKRSHNRATCKMLRCRKIVFGVGWGWGGIVSHAVRKYWANRSYKLRHVSRNSYYVKIVT